MLLKGRTPIFVQNQYMSQNKLSEVSTEDLLKRKKLFKGVLTGVGIMWVLLLGAAIYFYGKKSNVALFVPLIALPVTLQPAMMHIKALEKELKSRG